MEVTSAGHQLETWDRMRFFWPNTDVTIAVGHLGLPLSLVRRQDFSQAQSSSSLSSHPKFIRQIDQWKFHYPSTGCMGEPRLSSPFRATHPFNLFTPLSVNPFPARIQHWWLSLLVEPVWSWALQICSGSPPSCGIPGLATSLASAGRRAVRRELKLFFLC